MQVFNCNCQSLLCTVCIATATADALHGYGVVAACTGLSPGFALLDNHLFDGRVIQGCLAENICYRIVYHSVVSAGVGHP